MRSLPFLLLFTVGCGNLGAPGFRSAPGAADPGADLPDDTDLADEDSDPTVDDELSEDPTDDPVEDPPEPQPSKCPAGVICADTFPFVDANTTTGGTTDLDGYSCAPSTDESGPERVYRLDIPGDGLVAVSLSGLPAGVDVDVHILEDQDADGCLDRGHWDAAQFVHQGPLWVVVDSWTDSGGDAKDGDYDLTVGFTPTDAFEADGLREEVLRDALVGFHHAWMEGGAVRLALEVIDFEQPSIIERMWLVDLTLGELALREYVTHGEGSQDPNDDTLASSFSNTDGSHQSSLGVMVGGAIFNGSHGPSLRLEGLEVGTNDNVYDRAIIIHSADYATDDFIDSYGYLGRSWGCPAVDPAISDELIEALEDGGVLVSWYPDSAWRNNSDWLVEP